MEKQENNQNRESQKHGANPIESEGDQNVENYGFNQDNAREYGDTSGADSVSNIGGTRETGRYDDSRHDNENDNASRH
jgi:hypothetical protein